MSSVLVVDDERDIVDALEFNLKQAGFRVMAALDGATAVDLARKHRPDVVLLDLMLPDLSGKEVLRILRTEPSTRNAAVIVLTARNEEIDRVVGFELGADDYVTKPFRAASGSAASCFGGSAWAETMRQEPMSAVSAARSFVGLIRIVAHGIW